MFYTDKSQLIATISILQRENCVYDHIGFAQPAIFCDCKYGYKGKNKSDSSEQTGCPELRCVLHLLNKMTEKEYKKIMERKR